MADHSWQRSWRSPPKLIRIRARWRGRCHKCLGTILPGDVVDWISGKRRVQHIACPARTDLTAR